MSDYKGRNTDLLGVMCVLSPWKWTAGMWREYVWAPPSAVQLHPQSGSRHHTLTKIIEPEILAAQFVLVLIWLLAGESQGKFKVGCVSVGEWWGGVGVAVPTLPTGPYVVLELCHLHWSPWGSYTFFSGLHLSGNFLQSNSFVILIPGLEWTHLILWNNKSPALPSEYEARQILKHKMFSCPCCPVGETCDVWPPSRGWSQSPLGRLRPGGHSVRGWETLTAIKYKEIKIKDRLNQFFFAGFVQNMTWHRHLAPMWDMLIWVHHYLKNAMCKT